MNKKHLTTATGKPRTMISTACGITVEPRLAVLFAADVTSRYCEARIGRQS